MCQETESQPRSHSNVLEVIRKARNWKFRKRKDKVGGSIIQSFGKTLEEMKEVKTEARFSVCTVHLELCSSQLLCDAIMGRAKNIHAQGLGRGLGKYPWVPVPG